MEFYRACDLVLSSNIPLPELVRANESNSECSLQMLSARRSLVPNLAWLHQWHLPDGAPWLLLAKQQGRFLLRFPEFAEFEVSADCTRILCYPLSDTPADTLRHLLLDQVIPLILSQRGKLVLHASAVMVEGRAIAFLGATGQGKSTLAASFCRQGYPLLTDDCLLMEESGQGLLAIPSYPGLRLWSDALPNLYVNEPVLLPVAHYTTKKRLGIQDSQIPFYSAPLPVGRLYWLAPLDANNSNREIAIENLSGRDAFVELVKLSYRMDLTDREKMRGEFDRFGRVAALPLLRRLAFPHDFARLPAVREAVLADLGNA